MAYWFEVVTRPFDWSEIEVKVQSTNGDKSKGIPPTKALPVAYFDSRVVRRRLNEAFGPECWTAEHRELFDAQGRLVGVVCKLTCKVVDEKGNPTATVVREEVGVPSSIDPIKGAYSDSIKRAFAALGNDWLYDISLGWYPYTGKTYAPFAPEVLDKMREIYESQISREAREHPRVIAAPEEAERPEKPGRGVGAVLDRARKNGFTEQGAEPFSDEIEERIGAAPPNTVDSETGEIRQGGLL
jgi:hypothetical protein